MNVKKTYCAGGFFLRKICFLFFPRLEDPASGQIYPVSATFPIHLTDERKLFMKRLVVFQASFPLSHFFCNVL